MSLELIAEMKNVNLFLLTQDWVYFGGREQETCAINTAQMDHISVDFVPKR